MSDPKYMKFKDGGEISFFGSEAVLQSAIDEGPILLEFPASIEDCVCYLDPQPESPDGPQRSST